MWLRRPCNLKYKRQRRAHHLLGACASPSCHCRQSRQQQGVQRPVAAPVNDLRIRKGTSGENPNRWCSLIIQGLESCSDIFSSTAITTSIREPDRKSIGHADGERNAVHSGLYREFFCCGFLVSSSRRKESHNVLECDRLLYSFDILNISTAAILGNDARRFLPKQSAIRKKFDVHICAFTL